MNWSEQEEDGSTRVRMDFVWEDMVTDDETQIILFRLVPDPRRYSRVDEGGVILYIDKYLRHAIREEDMIKSCIEQMQGLPIHYLSANVESTPIYAESRKSALHTELSGGEYALPEEKAEPHRPLAEDNKSLAFLSVDICSGTSLRRANPTAFERAYEIFLRELATLVGQFHGTIYKTTGDGFIAYIDHPAFTRQCDMIVDLGLSCLLMMRDSINPALSETGLPTFSIRVGADYGRAYIRHLSVPATGFLNTEIGSDALNRAVKIEEVAGHNEFWIGSNLYSLLHVQWLERAEEVEFDGSSVGLEGYKAYRMK